MKAESTVRQAWARIEKWARKNMPGLIEEVAPPASRDEIERLEQFLGFPLPAEFVESLLVHDGEEGDGKLLDSGEGLLSVDMIRESMQGERANIEKYADLEGDNVTGPVRPELYLAGRVIIADFNRDTHLLLDFAPAPDGTPGQVVRRWVENGLLEVVASSWGAFLRDYADKLEQGRIELDPERAADLGSQSAAADPRVKRGKRFQAELEEQRRRIDFSRVPDGSRIELVGFLTVGWTPMSADEYSFGMHGKNLTLRGKLGITRDEIMKTIESTHELYMVRVGGVYHRKGVLGAHEWVDVESFRSFE